MAKHVKGILLLDYVRTIKRSKDIDWDKYLIAEDREIMDQMILASQWYSFATYQRMGVAIFNEIAKSNLELVRLFGKSIMDQFNETYRNLAADNDPAKTIKTFDIIYSRFFDFKAVQIEPGPGNLLQVTMEKDFGDREVEGYSHQMMGVFERLLEISGAENIQRKIPKKIWAGDPVTVFTFSWE